MADISNLKINEKLTNTIIENEINIKGQYENWQNWRWCGISNGRTIPKFANFLNSDNFPNQKENLNSKNI